MNSIIKEGLDKPLPIKFSTSEVNNPIIPYLLIKNYQGTTIWTHMGPLFINLMKQVNAKKAKSYKKKYEKLIKHYGNYLEVLNNNLTPFQSPFYMSDDSMLWAVNYLNL